MAPGLPDIAIKYGITNETIVAMTLSIFLISFAIGVSRVVECGTATTTNCFEALVSGTSIGSSFLLRDFVRELIY
jgi:hypothetical protein